MALINQAAAQSGEIQFVRDLDALPPEQQRFYRDLIADLDQETKSLIVDQDNS